MSAMPTPPDPREEVASEAEDFRAMLEENFPDYSTEQIDELIEQRRQASVLSGNVVDPTVPLDIRPVNMGAGAQSIRAMTPSEQARFDKQVEEEEDFQDFLRNANALGPMPDDTPGMWVWNRLAYGYARSKSPWGAAQQWIADIPVIGDPIAGIIRGGERGAVSVNNTIMGVLGYDLDQMPDTRTYQQEMSDFGTIGAISEGVSQFAFVAVPVIATAPQSAGTWATMAIASAVADATAFDPREGNISTMAREMFPETAIADLLQYTDSKEIYERTGSQWYARGVAAAEGFVVGETAAFTLGTLVGGLRGLGRLGSEISAEANPAMGGAGGMLTDFGMPADLAAKQVDPSSFYHLDRLRALIFARNARAQALINEGGLSNKEMLEVLNKEFADLPDPMDLQRRAWADVMFELHKGTPQEMPKEAWVAMAQNVEPGRTFMASSELPPGSDWHVYQNSSVAARAIRAATQGLDTPPGPPMNSRFVNESLQGRIDEFVEANNLTPEQAQHLVNGMRDAMKGEPLERWPVIEIDGEIQFADGLPKFDENGMPNWQVKFKPVTEVDGEIQYGVGETLPPENPIPLKPEVSQANDDAVRAVDEAGEAVEEAQPLATDERGVPVREGDQSAVTIEARPWVLAKPTPAERRWFEELFENDAHAQEFNENGIWLNENGSIEIHDPQKAWEYLDGWVADSPANRGKLPPSFHKDNFLDRFVDPEGNPMGQARPGPTQGPKRPPGDQRFFEAETDDEGVIQVVRGVAQIDTDEGIAFVQLFEAADAKTVVHELGHVARAQTLGKRAKRGGGNLTPEDIAEVEAEFGVVDGVWTTDQEEAFAKQFVEWIEAGGPRSEFARTLPKHLQRSYSYAAASIRSVARDVRNRVEMTDATRDALDKINVLSGLPERYAPNRYVEVADFSEVWKRVQEAEAAGQDWREVVRPEDILGTAKMSKTGRLRFDASTPEEAQALIAHFNAFVREGIESGVLLRGRTLEDMRESALRSLNEMMGRDNIDITETMRELLGSVDMTRTGDGALDAKLLTAQMLLHYKADALLKMAEQAGRTRKVTDMALVHRAALEYQVVQAQLSSAYTNWGRAGQAIQGVKLPSPEELTNPDAAEKFLVSIGMPPGSLTGDSETLINALAHARLPDDYAAVAKASSNVSQQRSMWQKIDGVMREFYVNNLLSGAKTWFGLSVTSPALNMMWDGASRFVGGLGEAGLGIWRGDLSGLGQSWEAMRSGIRNFQNSLVAAEYAMRSLISGRGTLMPGVELYDGKTGVGNIRMDDGSQPVRALVNGVGTVVRSPSRAIMTFDEFFRQVNARTALQEKFGVEAHDELLAAAIESGSMPENFTPRQLRQWRRANSAAIKQRTSDMIDTVIRDGRIRDQHAVIDEAMNDPRIMAIEDEFERAKAIQQYFSDEFTDTHARNVAYARDHATRAVFQGELSGVGKDIQNILDNNFGGALRYVVPFFRTPWKIQEKFFALNPVTNISAEIGSRIRNRATAGTWEVPENSNLWIIHRRHLEDLGSGDPKRVAEARGRQMMGAALVGTSWALVDSGSITGGGPRDWKKLEELKATGWQPYSFRYETGELDELGQPIYKYVSYLGMDPYAQYLALMADAYYLMYEEDYRGRDEERYRWYSSLILVMGRQIHEKPYIQGISNLFKAIGDLEVHGAAAAENLSTGFIPFSSMSSQLDYATDPYVLEARTYAEKVRSKSILWADDWGPDLEPRYNALGERIEIRSDGVNDFEHYVWNRVLPFRVSEDKTDALGRILYDYDVSNQPPRTVLNDEEITMGGDIDLLEIPASPQLIEALGIEDFNDEWSVYAVWNERIRTMRPRRGFHIEVNEKGEEVKVSGGMTLREALAEVVSNEDLASIATWEHTGIMGGRVKRIVSEVIQHYRRAALAWVFENSPALQAENLGQIKEQLESIERDAARTHPNTRIHRDAVRAVEDVNKELEKITGAGE